MAGRSTRHRIGIDLGGSKIGGIVLAPDGTVLAERRVATPAGSYDGTLDAIALFLGGYYTSTSRPVYISPRRMSR